MHWVLHYNIATDDEPSVGVTFDVDFLATRRDAKSIHEKLGGSLRLASLLDFLSGQTQVGKLFVANFHEEADLEIDFMGAMIGGDEDGAKKRAVAVEIAGVKLRVLHPFDVLRTRIANLHSLPGRLKNERYILQAKLAIQVMRCALSELWALEDDRPALRATEGVIDIALSRAGRRVWKEKQLDVLDAIPITEIKNRPFLEKRWPQARAYVEQKRG